MASETTHASGNTLGHIRGDILEHTFEARPKTCFRNI
jgi:hypothetical protein